MRCRDDDEELSWLRDGNDVEPCRFWGVRLRGEFGRVVLTRRKVRGWRRSPYNTSCSRVRPASRLALRTASFAEPESPVVSVVVGRIRVPALGPCACRVGSWRVIGSRADK